MSVHRTGTLLMIASLILAGCSRKAVVTPDPPPSAPPTQPASPPASAPTITLRAAPASIERGSTLTLTWQAANATGVRIEPGVGDVELSGSRAVTPASSVTYTATATGPGGTATDTARVTVNVAAPPAGNPPLRTEPNVSVEELFRQRVQTIHFDYDQAAIRDSEMDKLRANAQWLKDNPAVRFTLEGHCDERGSQEYNIGLGDRRVNAVKEFLVSQGVAESRFSVVSYGEERPVCTDESEDCFSKNRRAEFRLVP